MKPLKLNVMLLLFSVVFTACSSRKTEISEKERKSSWVDWSGYDALVSRIKTENDADKRLVLMHQAEDMLMDTGIVVPISEIGFQYIQKSSVTGIVLTPQGILFFYDAQKKGDTTLRLQFTREPENIDPACASDAGSASLVYNSFSGLFTASADGSPVPDLVHDYSVSADGLVYTFNLRKNLKWSDGTKLDADDFVYSWNRVIEPSTGAAYRYYFENIDGYADGKLNIRSADNGNQLIVRLSRPSPIFLKTLILTVFFPVQRKAVTSAERYRDAAGHVINPCTWTMEAGFPSNGPFVLKSWKHNENLIFEKNPFYYNADKIKINRVELMLTGDSTASMTAYAKGDIDFSLSLSADVLKTYKTNPEIHVAPGFGIFGYQFNMQAPLFYGKTPEQAAAIRKAVSMLIDRNFLTHIGNMGINKPNSSLIPDTVSDGKDGRFKIPQNGYSYPYPSGYFSQKPDLKQARRLLESAGYIFDKDGTLSAQTPMLLSFTDLSSDQLILECIQQDLLPLGIIVNMDTSDFMTCHQKLADLSYTVGWFSWLADYNDPQAFLELFTSDNGNNNSGLGRD